MTKSSLRSDEDTNKLRELLLTREARGLRVPLIARIGIGVFALGNVVLTMIFAESSQDDLTLDFLILLSLLGGLVLNAWVWFGLRSGRHIERFGTVGAAFDAVLVVAFSGLALKAGQSTNLPAGFVFESELPMFVATMVAINGLALRARYPLIVGVGALVSVLWPAALAMTDPATQWSADRNLVYMGPATDPSSVITTIVMLVGTVLAVTLAAHTARQTVRAAIVQELANARLQREQLQVVMREKVSAIGRLVAGISHEINSPIGALRSSVDTQGKVFERLQAGLPVAESSGRTERMLKIGQQSLGAMRTASERLVELETSLRALSHIEEAEFRKVTLRRELDSVVEAVQREHKTRPKVAWSAEADVELYLRASDFNQALLTIVRNAFEAAGSEGTVTFGISSTDDAVTITIGDDGPGIEADRIAGLFDVSLERKGKRVGAGLGLAAAQSVVQGHGGHLSVASEAGKGAVFQIHLPKTTPG